MLANWVKENTTTTGTGTITLGGAVTGFIAFADALADGDVVFYSVKDGNNRENGIGTFTASGTTLARTKVLETLVSGVYDNTSPAAITLSGSAEVSISGMAQHLSDQPVADTYVRAASAEWKIPDNFSNYGSNNNIATANRMILLPAVFNNRKVISKIVFELNTIDAATTNLRYGLYRCNEDGSPGNIIFDSGDMSSLVTTATGLQSYTLSSPQEIPKGQYWSAVVSDSTVITISGPNYLTITGGSNFINRFDNDRRRAPYESNVTGALPSVPTISNTTIAYGYGFGWQ